ncbi:MAG: putative lipid II flippase FtsW [Oscillospiraceae bacterium]|nr:putative lipid II flippase FtsW [Oscillospiraceae bacterium]
MNNVPNRGGVAVPSRHRQGSRRDSGKSSKSSKKNKRINRLVEFFRKRERLAKFDIPFFVNVMVLLVFGTGMLLSASFSIANREYGDSWFFFNRQVWFIGIGLGVMILLSFVNYRILMNKTIVLLIAGISVALMLAVKLGLGTTQGGAERWLVLFGYQFQPSEILKFALIIVLAYITQKNPEKLYDFWRGFVPFGLIIGIACVLTAMQPHLSGTIIMFGIGVTLMVVSPVKFKNVIIMFIGLGIAAVIGINIMNAIGYDYMGARWQSFVAPESDIQGKTFQTYQSLVTIGSGDWFGLGLGNSRQKFAYLPAPHNDFIYSVICEELGFVGGVLVLMLFVVLVMRGFYIAVHARDRFGMMLAAGITAQIGIQAFLNIAVATKSIPNTGITLPFFSYGGTAILMMLAQIGVLLNISRKIDI